MWLDCDYIISRAKKELYVFLVVVVVVVYLHLTKDFHQHLCVAASCYISTVLSPPAYYPPWTLSLCPVLCSRCSPHCLLHQTATRTIGGRQDCCGFSRKWHKHPPPIPPSHIALSLSCLGQGAAWDHPSGEPQHQGGGGAQETCECCIITGLALRAHVFSPLLLSLLSV